MASLAEIEALLASDLSGLGPRAGAEAYLSAGEGVLEAWLVAHGEKPTDEAKEGFRLLALHRQGAKGDPSFNACRETCRELAYHYNIVTDGGEGIDPASSLTMMRFVARHLYLFISGKLEEAGLGEFCCSSKPLRASGG